MAESIEERVRALEREIAELKGRTPPDAPSAKRRVSLRGLLKGLRVDEEDIRAARSEFFREKT